jgi:hypothetical protein
MAAVRSPAPRAVLAPEAPSASIPSVARETAPPRRRGPVPTPLLPESARPQEPEVLIPPGQEEALRRFVTALRDGTAPVPPLLATGASVGSLIVPAPLIEIAPLEANPLADSVELPERSHS